MKRQRIIDVNDDYEELIKPVKEKKICEEFKPKEKYEKVHQEKARAHEENDIFFPSDIEIVEIPMQNLAVKTNPIDGESKKRDKNKDKKPHSVPKKTVEKILGFTDDYKDKQLYVVVKFKESSRKHFILNKVMRKQYPQELLDHYEANIEWDDSE